MRERLADRSPSVVVFSIDHLPASVAPVPADTVLFRRYLDAGGKVVWPGIPPMIWPRDPKTGEGTDYIQIDRAGTSRLLGVDHARSNFDNYGARGDRRGAGAGDCRAGGTATGEWIRPA